MFFHLFKADEIHVYFSAFFSSKKLAYTMEYPNQKTLKNVQPMAMRAFKSTPVIQFAHLNCKT